VKNAAVVRGYGKETRARKIAGAREGKAGRAAVQ